VARNGNASWRRRGRAWRQRHWAAARRNEGSTLCYTEQRIGAVRACCLCALSARVRATCGRRRQAAALTQCWWPGAGAHVPRSAHLPAAARTRAVTAPGTWTLPAWRSRQWRGWDISGMRYHGIDLFGSSIAGDSVFARRNYGGRARLRRARRHQQGRWRSGRAAPAWRQKICCWALPRARHRRLATTRVNAWLRGGGASRALAAYLSCLALSVAAAKRGGIMRVSRVVGCAEQRLQQAAMISITRRAYCAKRARVSSAAACVFSRCIRCCLRRAVVQYHASTWLRTGDGTARFHTRALGIE